MSFHNLVQAGQQAVDVEHCIKSLLNGRLKNQTFVANQKKADKLFKEGYKLAFGKSKKTKRPWATIIKLWSESAGLGHKRALFYLGTCYDFKLGVNRDIKKAFQYYLQAAELGHSDSQYNVGFFYKTGEIFKADQKKKIFWYKKAAKQGLIDGQRDLGYAYFYGEGVKKNLKMAVSWYKKAAKKYDDKAFYNLGLCYKYGDGVNKSSRWARHYFSRALEQGHKGAKRQLRALSTD